ncbi:hypothetical protein SprV_0501763500 [Sparganum proliferum]
MFKMASRMRQARDRQRESFALSDSDPGISVANISRYRSSSKRGHGLPPLLNNNQIFLIDDTYKAVLFSAFFAKHLNTESEPVPLFRSFSDRTLSAIDVSSDLFKKHISRLKNSHCSGTDGIPNSIIEQASDLPLLLNHLFSSGRRFSRPDELISPLRPGPILRSCRPPDIHYHRVH